MTPQEFVENIRQEIREEGFMSAVRLAAVIAHRSVDFKVNANAEEIMQQIVCDDIHTIEYVNYLTNYACRRKDLYYFLPKEQS